MRRTGWGLILAVSFTGCAVDDEQLLRDYCTNGLNQFQKGDYLSARENYQAALTLRPGDPGLLYNVGQCYDRQGGGSQAERYYGDCLKQTPEHPACRHALASLLVREGR